VRRAAGPEHLAPRSCGGSGLDFRPGWSPGRPNPTKHLVVLPKREIGQRADGYRLSCAGPYDHSPVPATTGPNVIRRSPALPELRLPNAAVKSPRLAPLLCGIPHLPMHG
jgi:hypothetical protein